MFSSLIEQNMNEEQALFFITAGYYFDFPFIPCFETGFAAVFI